MQTAALCLCQPSPAGTPPLHPGTPLLGSPGVHHPDKVTDLLVSSRNLALRKQTEETSRGRQVQEANTGGKCRRQAQGGKSRRQAQEASTGGKIRRQVQEARTRG